MSKKLKVGVIGVGGIAKTHLPGWKESPHTELVAMADINEEILTKVATEHEVKLRYTKIDDLLANKDLDIIDVCTPSAYHAPLSIAGLERGKHVICEKPLAPTPAEIKKMIAARDKSGRLLMTAQHFRYMGNCKALKAEIETGILGEIYHARCWMLRRNGVPNRPGFVEKKNSGGGPCIDIGVHILDLCLWLMGNPRPISVCGITQDKIARQPGAFSAWGGTPLLPSFDVEEFASAFVRLNTGATLILETSWLLHHISQEGEDMQLWIYGDKGGCQYPSLKIASSNNTTKQLLTTQLQRTESTPKPHALECKAFAEAIVSGKPSPVPPEQSLAVQQILDGLYRSTQEGREVKIEE